VCALLAGGRLVIIGCQGGLTGELNIGTLMGRRACTASIALRLQPVPDKGRTVAEVRENLWPFVERGCVRPVIGHTIPLREAGEAHRSMEKAPSSARSC
jgi:NADPH:quinone reductase-like Zn-dependent oxidoreductase